MIGLHGTSMQKVYFLSNLPTRLQWQDEIGWLVGMLLLHGPLGMTVFSNGIEYGNSKYLRKSKRLCGILLITVYQYERNLARRGIVINTRCPVCARLDEDCGHLFFKCKYAKLCWRMMNMEPIRVQLLNCGSAWKTCNIIGKLEKDTQLKVIIFLWRWWSARNKANDGEGC